MRNTVYTAAHLPMEVDVFIVRQRSIIMVPAEVNAVGAVRHQWDQDACTARRRDMKDKGKIMDNSTVRIIKIDREADFELPEGKTDNFMIIELTLFPGRSKEQKKQVIETITHKLNKELGIRNTDVFIVINEPPLENWGLAGKQKE